MRKWENKGFVDPAAYRKASAAGIYVTLNIPKEFGGRGITDFR